MQVHAVLTRICITAGAILVLGKAYHHVQPHRSGCGFRILEIAQWCGLRSFNEKVTIPCGVLRVWGYANYMVPWLAVQCGGRFRDVRCGAVPLHVFFLSMRRFGLGCRIIVLGVMWCPCPSQAGWSAIIRWPAPWVYVLVSMHCMRSGPISISRTRRTWWNLYYPTCTVGPITWLRLAHTAWLS